MTSGQAAATEPASDPTTGRGPGIVRNISFNNIRATVTSDPAQLADVPFISGYNVGEKRSCIVLNGGFDGLVRVYGASDGRLLTTLPTGRIIASQAAVVKGSVYVGSGIEGSNINGKGLGEPGGAIQAYSLLDLGG